MKDTLRLVFALLFLITGAVVSVLTHSDHDITICAILVCSGTIMIFTPDEKP